MIDTHSHIYGSEFDEDREEVIRRAREAGVEKILLPNINRNSVKPMLQLCSQYPGYCFPMMGLHPEDVKGDYQEVLDDMFSLLETPENPYVAIGEVGLDFYWEESFREEQLDAFGQQVDWAASSGLPLMIHCRSAHQEMVDVLKAHNGKDLKGVFHCFGGSLDEAFELLDFEGFALGIGGVLTFRKSTLPEAVRRVPLDRIVLETDSPYLAPVPHRGKRNESSFVAAVLLRLAQERNLPPEYVEEVTNKTVSQIFPKAASLCP